MPAEYDLPAQTAYEALIATTPATDLRDAAVQVAPVLSIVDLIKCADEGPEADYITAQRMLSSVLALLIRQTGIDPDEYAIHHYINKMSYWPEGALP